MNKKIGAQQAGPLMKQVIIDGDEIILPIDAKLYKPYPVNGTEEEQRRWIEMMDAEPLSGTW